MTPTPDNEKLEKLLNKFARSCCYGNDEERKRDSDAIKEAFAAALLAEASPAPTWHPIATAPKRECLWLYAKELVDADFNPTGTVDGHWQDDVGWQGAVWDGYRDEWRTKTIEPTHWMMPFSPEASPAPKVGEPRPSDIALAFKTLREHRQTMPKGLEKAGVGAAIGILADALAAQPSASVQEPVAQLRYEGRETPKVVSWNNLPDGVHKVYTAAPAAKGAEPWISVEDRVPEVGQEVLVFGKSPWESAASAKVDMWDELHEAPVSFSSATICVGEGWSENDDSEITHWMPLPPNPSGIGKQGGSGK